MVKLHGLIKNGRLIDETSPRCSRALPTAYEARREYADGILPTDRQELRWRSNRVTDDARRELGDRQRVNSKEEADGASLTELQGHQDLDDRAAREIATNTVAGATKISCLVPKSPQTLSQESWALERIYTNK